MTATLTQPTTTDALGRFKAGEPGVYEGIPAEDYFALDACSNSALKVLAEFSPEHCRYSQTHDVEATDPQRLGTAAHMALFEPELFYASYVKPEQCSASKRDGDCCTNPGKTKHGELWLCGTHGKDLEPDDPGGEVLSVKSYASCAAIKARAYAHTTLGPALRGKGGNEISIVWVDPATGLLCRSRIDRWCTQVDMFLDAKTTTNANEFEFARTVAKYKYHRQAAFYRRGMRVLGHDIKHCCTAAFETKPPYCMAFYRFADQWLDAYDKLITADMYAYSMCKKNNAWPGYPNKLIDLGIAPWEEKELQYIGGIE